MNAKMKQYYELIPDRRYIVERKTTKIKKEKEILEGIFVQLVSHRPTAVLMRCMRRKSLPNVAHFGFCYDSDIFYDIEEIRNNGRKAIQSFEQRSLNLILKRLINEEFEW
jgi:hypothetical protein